MKNTLMTLALVCAAAFHTAGQQVSVDKLIDKGIWMQEKGDFVGALDYYRKAIEADTTDDKPLYDTVLTFLAANKYEIAIEYTGRIIQRNGRGANRAFLLKGATLVFLQRLGEAVEVYVEGLQRFPHDRVLRSNTARTCFKNKQISDAEYHAVKAIEVDPFSPVNHYILGCTMVLQDKPVHSALCFYYFLLLENRGDRARLVLDMLQKKLAGGEMKRPSPNLGYVEAVKTVESREFSNAARQVMTYTTIRQLTHPKTSRFDLFYEQTKTLFRELERNQAGKQSSDIWSTFYLPLFWKMNKGINGEIMCYYTLASSEDEEVNDWLARNRSRTDQLRSWLEKTSAGYLGEH
jgi:hypothetical protein